MAFINDRNDAMLTGKNAPKRNIDRVAELIVRQPPIVTPLNAPAQLREMRPLSSAKVTPLQKLYVTSIMKAKVGSKNTTGVPSWDGLRFGR